MLANKITAVTLVLLSVILYVFVIPNQIEPPIFAGWTTPATVPNIVVVGIAVMAFIQFFNKKSPESFDIWVLIKSLLLAGVGIFSMWVLGRVGFLVVAPLLSAGVMILVGERRILWLGVGLIIPIVLWIGVVVVLGRSLP